MWVICMTTDSIGCHVDNFLTEKALYHFSLSKEIPKKTKFNLEYLKVLDHYDIDYFITERAFSNCLGVAAL